MRIYAHFLESRFRMLNWFFLGLQGDSRKFFTALRTAEQGVERQIRSHGRSCFERGVERIAVQSADHAEICFEVECAVEATGGEAEAGLRILSRRLLPGAEVILDATGREMMEFRIRALGALGRACRAFRWGWQIGRTVRRLGKG